MPDGSVPEEYVDYDYDYGQYNHDYDYAYDDSPHPPSRLDTLLPLVTFECAHAGVEGYHADTDFDCEVFHYCGADGTRYTFLCGEGSKFHQKRLICDFDHNLRCGEDGALHQSTPIDTLNTEHLFPAGEILKNGVTRPLSTPAAHSRPPVVAVQRRPEPAGVDARPDGFRRRPVAEGPGIRPQRRPQVFPQPLPARRHDTLPVQLEENVYSNTEEQHSRPLDRYQNGAATAQRRLGVPEDRYQAALKDIHGIIRDTEAFQLPVLPLLNKGGLQGIQSRQDGPLPEEGAEAPRTRLHLPRRTANARRDAYGPTPLRRPLLKRRQRQIKWEDHGLLALRDIVDSKVSQFFPSSDAAQDRTGRQSVQRKEREFLGRFYNEFPHFGPGEEFDESPGFMAESRSDSEDYEWDVPEENDVLEPVAVTGPERALAASNIRSARQRLPEFKGYAQTKSPVSGSKTSLYSVHDVEPTDSTNFGKRVDSEPAPNEESNAFTYDINSDTDIDDEEDLVTEASTTTEVEFDGSEYGSPKSSSIIEAYETASFVGSESITRPHHQRLQRRQFVPRNEGVDNMRDLQRFLGPNLQNGARLQFQAPQPQRPFINTQFVNVGPSGARFSGPAVGQPGDERNVEPTPAGSVIVSQQRELRRIPINPPRQQPVALSDDDQPLLQPFESVRQSFRGGPRRQPQTQNNLPFVPSGPFQPPAVSSFRAPTPRPRPQTSFLRPAFQDQRFISQPRPPFNIGNPLPGGFRPIIDSNRQSAPPRPGTSVNGVRQSQFPPTSVQDLPPARGSEPRLPNISPSFDHFNTGLVAAPNPFGFNTFVVPHFVPTFTSTPSSTEPPRLSTDSDDGSDSESSELPHQFPAGRLQNSFFPPSRRPTVQVTNQPAQFSVPRGPQTGTFGRPQTGPFGAVQPNSFGDVLRTEQRPTEPPLQNIGGISDFEDAQTPTHTAVPFLPDASQPKDNENAFIPPSRNVAPTVPPPPHISSPLPDNVIHELPEVTVRVTAQPARRPVTSRIPVPPRPPQTQRPPRPRVTEPEVIVVTEPPQPLPTPTSARRPPDGRKRFRSRVTPPDVAVVTGPPRQIETTPLPVRGISEGRRRFRPRRPGTRVRRPLQEITSEVAEHIVENVANEGHTIIRDGSFEQQNLENLSNEVLDVVNRGQSDVTIPVPNLVTNEVVDPKIIIEPEPPIIQNLDTGINEEQNTIGVSGFSVTEPSLDIVADAGFSEPEVHVISTTTLTTTTTTTPTTTSAPVRTRPTRRRPGRRRRPSHKRTTTTAAPEQAQPEVSEAPRPTEAPRSLVLRRRRPGRIPGRLPSRRRLRTRIRQQTTEADATDAPSTVETTEESPAVPSPSEAPVTSAPDAPVRGAAFRRRRPGSRAPGSRRRFRFRATETPKEESSEVVSSEVETTVESSELSAGVEEQGIRATAAEIRQMREQGEQNALRTTQLRLRELYERRRSRQRSGIIRRRKTTKTTTTTTTTTTAAPQSLESSTVPASEPDTTTPEPEVVPTEPATTKAPLAPAQGLRRPGGRRAGSRRLTPSRVRSRTTVKPTAEGVAAKETVENAPDELVKQEEAVTASPTRATRPTGPGGRPLRRRFRPDRTRTRQRVRRPLIERNNSRTGVSTLASLLETTELADRSTTASPLATVNEEVSNREQKDVAVKRTLLGPIRRRRPQTTAATSSPPDPPVSSAVQVTQTTITPVLAETENPSPRATKLLGEKNKAENEVATTIAEEAVTANVVITDETTTTSVASTTTAPDIHRTSTVTDIASTTATITTSEQNTPSTSTSPTTTPTHDNTAGTEDLTRASTERIEFIPFDSGDMSLDSIVELVPAASSSTPRSSPTITMATDSPLLPLQSLFAGF